MSWENRDGLERGGDCAACGEPVKEAHHAYCRSCYADLRGWDHGDDEAAEPWRERCPPSGTPESFILAPLELRREIAALRDRNDQLEPRAA
jgi:hypothetical protein